MSKELDELKLFIAEHGLADKYADQLHQMEMAEAEAEELEEANAEMRKNLEQAQANRLQNEALKALQKDVAEIKKQTGEKPLTKEDIMSIKDDHKRLQAIRENMYLFSRNVIEQTPQQKADEFSNLMELKHYGITDESLEHLTIEDVIKIVPSGLARQYAIRRIKERNQ